MAETPGAGEAEFAGLERRIVDQYFELYPTAAVSLGRHDYDGRLPMVAPEATATWLERADLLLWQLKAPELDELPAERKIDRFLLRLLLEGPIFDLREAGEYARNPMVYLFPLSLTPYTSRAYAPAAQRAEAIAALLGAVPAFLEEADDRLAPALPRPFLELSLAMAGGLSAHFGEGQAFVDREVPSLSGRVRRQREGADAAVARFAARLREDRLPQATERFALGPELYQRLLFVREGLETPFPEMEAAGRADLLRNQERLAEIARAQGSTPEAMFERLRRDHPSAGELIPTAQREVDFTRTFVGERDLVTIPEPAVCRVEESPLWGRALFTASMDSPGPFERTADEGIYYVTPVDPSWAPAQQEEWLRSLNRTMLRNITVHEVFPGHYLQFLHLRKSRATLARNVYMSPSFVEGWAHYCEQLAIEAGMGSVWDEVAQIHDALLRDARLLASVGLHTRGMSVEAATKLIEEAAHFEPLPARREAIRGTFNPEYFCYTLGKLAILKARAAHLTPRFGGSLRAFHDALLAGGCPPIGLLDRVLAA